MADVPAEIVKQLKEKYPDRSLHQVEKFNPDDTSVSYTFIMTGPTRDELSKFDEEVVKAQDIKGSKVDKAHAVRGAAERAAMALIRWPDRDEVKRIFDMHPEMIYSFAQDIRNFAGDNFETRTKKL